MLNESWVDQYKCMQRSYTRLCRVADQYNAEAELHQPDNARDALYHFCCDVFHLKDWITECEQVGADVRSAARQVLPKKNLSEIPQSVAAIAACADIANASKHLKLNHGSYTPSGPAEPTKQVQGAKFPRSLPFHFAATHWTIRVGEDERDVLELATEAVAAWDSWLHEYGLLPLAE
ncbi:hypothetical protein A5740_27320 [Mycobacterium sp. GA-1841]|uniref:hypothetical protein n=1 Tax=Mycobacterium sp. GA-1841 TaxID=1834154 RepID=UPI00096C4AD1|nr:hypothetical protein [Mycobacterium sp. GA-1841]OMC38333.1 hypothetical protein A5740_27320 [Mycobacterium sp. GA-1841]